MDIGAWHCHGSVENGKYYYMDATAAYRQACLKAIIYLTHFGFTGSQAYMLLTAAPVEGGIVVIPNCACTVSIPLYDYHCVECDEVLEAMKCSKR